MSSLKEICSGLPIDPIPRAPGQRDNSVPHAPVRTLNLSQDEELVSSNGLLPILFERALLLLPKLKVAK